MAARPSLMGHIPHLLISDPWDGPLLALSAGQVHHLEKVLRRQAGDAVSYTDGAGVIGTGRLAAGRIERGDEALVESWPEVEVAVAPPDSRSRARFIVEKLAELGVRRLIWVRTRHSEGRPPPETKARAWATAALEQSRGAWGMDLAELRLDELDEERLVVTHPAPAAEKTPDAPPAGPPIILIGPEGGLDDAEMPDRAARMWLGPSILRVETAAVAATVMWYAKHAPDLSR